MGSPISDAWPTDGSQRRRRLEQMRPSQTAVVTRLNPSPMHTPPSVAGPLPVCQLIRSLSVSQRMFLSSSWRQAETFSSYGYLQKSTATGLKDRRSLLSPPGRRTSNVARDFVTIFNDNGGSADGQIMFESLISQGAIALNIAGSYVGAGGFIREWDSCSSTVRFGSDSPFCPSLTSFYR